MVERVLQLVCIISWLRPPVSAFFVDSEHHNNRFTDLDLSHCQNRLRPRRLVHRKQISASSATKRESYDATNSSNSSFSAKSNQLNKHSRLSLAPMMDYTNRHFRAMVRLVSENTLLYTEMVAADDLVNGRNKNDIQQLLGQSATISEGPSVLQLGGNDPSLLRHAANIYHEYFSQNNNDCQYTCLNLNVGCPSPAISGKKCFGAALMKDPAHVAKLVRAMSDGVEGRLPITVKCRIGLHDNDTTPFSRQLYHDKRSDEDEYEELRKFVHTVASDGIVTNFQIHARIAVLGGSFSPADNRKVPPLKYEHVRKLAREFPELSFVLNGGIHSLSQAKEQLEADDLLAGVMVGRAFAANPWSFAMADELLYGDSVDDESGTSCVNRRELIEAYGRHADYEEDNGEPAQIRRSLVAACAHLFAGEQNSRQFRMELDEIAGRPERLEREATAQVWSSTVPSSPLASAFSAPSTLETAVGWDDMQAMDDARPAWDENEPPLSELILEAAQRNFGNDVLDLNRRESYDKQVWEQEEEARRRKYDPVLSIDCRMDKDEVNNDGKKVSGGVVDGWFSNGLN